MKVKLSPAQRRALEQMARGDTVIREWRSTVARWESGVNRAPGVDTLSDLRQRGLIRRADKPGTAVSYSITDAGREALTQGETR